MEASTDLEVPLLPTTDNLSKYFDAFTNAGIWSHITFRWLNPLFQRGDKQKLELSHIPSIPQSEKAETASLLLEKSLEKLNVETTPSLFRAITHAIWRSLAINAIFAGTNTIASYMGPFLVTTFVNFLYSKNDTNYHYGLILALIFFIAKTTETLTQRQWCFGARRIGIRVQAAITTLIYKKSFLIKHSGLSNGKIINLIDVDVERIGEFFMHVHGIWLFPVQVFLACYILYRDLGVVPSIVALLVTIFAMLSNIPLAKRQKVLHSKIMEAKDSRMKATSEALKGIRVLKLQAWEPTFLKKILDQRENERSFLKRYLYTCSTIAFLFWASPILVSAATFGVCIALGIQLTTSTVLSALATFRILQEPIYNLPELLSIITQTKVSMSRIQDFFIEEDRGNVISYQSSGSADVAMEIEVGEYSWENSDQSLRKSNITITNKIDVIKGHKVAVCGAVGSGKSSLLSSILGEIPRISGNQIKIYGTKAYVPQSAWIQTGTIRENILFGEELDVEFYNNVLEACALNRDIKMWKDGDLSIVGERGINLSGGQKQRVQLARAVYSDTDVYILDDPFSAVDAHTGAHLFKHCLKELLSEKTVIYATHHLEYLDAADIILVIKDGSIVQSGKYNELKVNPDSEFCRQLNAYKKSIRQVDPYQHDNQLNLNHVDSIEERVKENSHNDMPGRLQEEEAEIGRVKWSIYRKFVTSAYGGALVPVILLCQTFFQLIQIGSNYWIAWASEGHGVSPKQMISIFILLSCGSSVLILGRTVFLSTIAIETGRHLFSDMITSVFRAPISFFDNTPSSRILNRSSTDQRVVDMDIPYRLAGLVFAVIQLISIIILMSQVAWPVIFLFAVILVISIWHQKYYTTSARELARMVGIQKGITLHHFSESLAGVATIRSFNQKNRFLMNVLKLIDDSSRVTFHNSATMEWLCTRINSLFNFGFFLVLVFLVSLPKSSLDPSFAGLAATYGLNLNVIQGWVIWNLCNTENKMISVERILQFTKIPSEAPLAIDDCRPSPEWPTEGTVELQDLHVKYSPSLPMILKGLSCTFTGGKKIGVVGRTGSGKSTLIQALFRVVEPSSGIILIDGLDICKIGLADLRSRLGIIPQDPTMFQGSLRSNIDPLEQHADHELSQVLTKCRLERFLDAKVAEDGENWSVGQRQLVCLARVLLKKRKILVLDEATASIDTETDNMIQETIRQETSQCTVITIAHRIPTILDSDLVLVLDDGKIAEYDAPSQLLKDPQSAFSKLVSQFRKVTSKNNDSENQS